MNYKTHCCKEMIKALELKCDIHKNIYDCPDVVISYSSKFDEYGIIIHDGGSSSMIINYCPFCGYKLPESKRELWLRELEKLGYDDPWEQNIPEIYEDDRWYKNKS